MGALKFSVVGLQQAVAAQDRIRRGLKDQGDEVEKVTRSTAELGRITTRVQKETETGQQRLVRLLDQARDAYRNGTLGVKEWEKAQVKLNKEFESSTGQFKKFGDQSKDSFGASAIARIGQVAGGILSIREAIRLVTEEMAAQQQFVDAQGIAQTTLVQARSELQQNLLGFTGPQRVDIRNQFESIAGNKIDRSLTVQAGARAVSATGGDIDQAVGATRFATDFFQTRPSEIPLQAGAIADVMQLLGTDNPEEAFGFLTSVGALGRVVEPQFQAQSIPQTVARSLAFGATPVESGALFAAFTNVGKDRTGRRAATQNPELARQLSEFQFGIGDASTRLQQLTDVEIQSGALGQRQVDAIIAAESDLNRRQQAKALSGEGTAGLSALERIGLLQRSPGFAQEFLAGGSFGQATGLVTQLLTDPNSEIARKLADFTQKIPSTPAGLVAASREQLAGQLTDPLLARDVTRRGLGALGGDALALTQQRFLSNEELESLQNQRIAAGESALSIKALRFNERLSQGQLGLTLEDEIDQVRSQRNLTGAIRGADAPETQRMQELLDRLITLQEESNRTQEQVRDAIGEGGLTAGNE